MKITRMINLFLTAIFIISSLSLLIALLVNLIFTNKQEVKEIDVKIEYRDKTYEVKGICDSGNLLKEPISGKSVILVSIYSSLGIMIENAQDIRKKYIPYNVVNGKGILKGIVPSKILINNDEVTAIIAPIENKISDGYEAIIPSSLL